MATPAEPLEPDLYAQGSHAVYAQALSEPFRHGSPISQYGHGSLVDNQSMASTAQAIVNAELDNRQAGMGRAEVPENPFAKEDEVLQRFRCAYDEVNTETRGPLEVEEDPALAQAQTDRGWVQRLRNKLTRKGRRRERRLQAAAQIRETFPQLTTLHVVRVQRTWRGYITRKHVEQIRRQGGHIADLGARRVLRSAYFFGRGEHIADLPYRVLPLSLHGAFLEMEIDGTSSSVNVGAIVLVLLFKKKKCAWGLLFLIMLTVAFVTYLMPGFVALMFKTVFYDGDSSTSVKQMTSWLIVLAILSGALIGVLTLAIVYEETTTHNMLDFILAVVGLKKGRLVTMGQLQELRGKDLHVTIDAMYRHTTLGLVHFLHGLAGWITVLYLDPALGGLTACTVMAFWTATSLYDSYLVTQVKITKAMHAREGALMHFARQKRDEDCTNRNYQLGISKTILRMGTTFSKIHGVTLATSGMVTAASIVAFIYIGSERVQREKMSLNSLALAIAYFLFTLYSAYKNNEHAAAFISAHRSMQRLFKVVWHFRRFSEERTFKESECQVIAQAEGMKAIRQQPRSIDLFAIFAVGVLFHVIWLVFFGFNQGFLGCSNVAAHCELQDFSISPHLTIDNLMRKPKIITLGFSFSLYNACAPSAPLAQSLLTCAQHWDKTVRKYGFRPPYSFTSRLSYPGWRDDRRSFSKRFESTIANGTASVCPTYRSSNPDADPFLSERSVPNRTLTDGLASGYIFDEVSEPYFMQNSYQGCYAKQEKPGGPLCTTARAKLDPERDCWCAMGQQAGVAIDMDDPRCKANASGTVLRGE